MIATQNVWALVLAGGEGKRLHALTTQPGGTPVPKQFCSLRGDRSLIGEAIERGAALVDTERICAIVAADHHRWWAENVSLRRLVTDNLIVQPRNRGTAVGILYSTMRIASADPDALIVVLPSDHHVDDEGTLRESLVEAIQVARRSGGGPVLLGLQPDHADTELGYIVPGAADPVGGHRVKRFVEKPGASSARELIAGAALWNMFIVVAAARRIVGLFESRLSALLAQMRAIVASRIGEPRFAEIYERLPAVDFSRHVLEGQESSQRVVRVRPCGWSDLGTPVRVGETLRRLPPHDYAAAVARRSVYLNLAAQHEQLRGRA
jgi:mannose-1-phosphate guanylyltransferase